MRRADYISGFLGLLLAGYVWIVTGGFPEDQVVQVGPAFFPRILAIGLGCGSLALLVKTFLQRSAACNKGTFKFSDRGFLRAVVAFAATVLYCLVLEMVGFIPTSIIYLLFLMLLLKDKKFQHMVFVSVSVTLTLYFIFSVFLNITLPMGSLYGF